MTDDEFSTYGFDGDRGYTKEYVHDTLLRMYLYADKDNEYIYLFWF